MNFEKIRSFVEGIIKRINEDCVTVYAAQASFYVIIASIPFVTLLLSLTRFIIPLSFEEVNAAVRRFLPVALHRFAGQIVGELYTKSTGSVISLSVITALWPASRGVAAVVRGVRRVYRIKEPRGLMRNIVRSLLQTIVFLVILILGLVGLAIASGLVHFIAKLIPILGTVIDWISWLGSGVISVLICLMLAFIYRSVSRRKKILHQLWGAVFTTVGWAVFSVIFSAYIENYANYSYVYGSLAAIVLMMLWLYSMMIIFLLGAELNVLVGKPHRT